MKSLLFTVMLLSTSILAAEENIDLTTSEEIQAAKSISIAFDKVSEKVMKCIEENNGETEGCICLNRSECPFKAEFDNFINTFCGVVSTFPDWKLNNVLYQTEDGMGHSLGTATIQHHYGESC